MKKLFRTKKYHTVSNDLKSMVTQTKVFIIGILVFTTSRQRQVSIIEA